MPRMTHLWQHPRSNSYWYRRAVPKARQSGIGRVEFKKSLRTSDLAEATRRCAEADVEFNRLVFGQESESPPAIDIDAELRLRDVEAMVIAWRDGFIEHELEDYLAGGPLTSERRIQRAYEADDEAERYRAMIHNNEVDRELGAPVAEKLLKDRQLDPRAPPLTVELFCAAVTRAWADICQARARFARRNLAFRPADYLFLPHRNGQQVVVSPALGNAALKKADGRATGKTIEESLSRFLQEWQKPPKTIHEMKATVRLFCEFMGPGTLTATIEKPHVEEFKQALMKRPRAMTNAQRAMPLIGPQRVIQFEC